MPEHLVSVFSSFNVFTANFDWIALCLQLLKRHRCSCQDLGAHSLRYRLERHHYFSHFMLTVDKINNRFFNTASQPNKTFNSCFKFIRHSNFYNLMDFLVQLLPREISKLLLVIGHKHFSPSWILQISRFVGLSKLLKSLLKFIAGSQLRIWKNCNSLAWHQRRPWLQLRDEIGDQGLLYVWSPSIKDALWYILVRFDRRNKGHVTAKVRLFQRGD